MRILIEQALRNFDECGRDAVAKLRDRLIAMFLNFLFEFINVFSLEWLSLAQELVQDNTYGPHVTLR